jgi:hypothetical protein
MGEHAGVIDKSPHQVHFHRWGKWSPWFQRHNLVVWQSARSCRKCGKVQTRLM